MKKRIVYWFTSGSISGAATGFRRLIKVLQIQSLQGIRDIGRSAADEYEKSHPGVKVQFDYLENEASKAKMSTLRNLKTARACSTVGGGCVMSEQSRQGVARISTRGSPVRLKTPSIRPAFRISSLRGSLTDCQLCDQLCLPYNKDLCKSRVAPTRSRNGPGLFGCSEKMQSGV